MDRIRPVKIKIALWLWAHLSGGRAPFYSTRKLARHKTYLEPGEQEWFGWKLKIWNTAVDYLKRERVLTYTPTLREKF